MDKIVKKLLINSIKLRNISALSNHSTLQTCVNSSQGTLVCKDLEKYKEEKDIEKLNSLSVNYDLYDVIKNIQQNYKNMDVKEAINVMDILKKSLPKNKEASDINLKDSEEFIHICKLIHKNVRSLYAHDIIKTLRILLFFNVPPNSILIQMLLQMIRVSLNNLSVGQIIILYNTLNKLEKLPLVESLLIALPYVFKQQAQFELNTKSNNLLEALKFSCVINDLNTKLYIINILHKRKRSITLSNVVDILYALSTLPVMNSASIGLLFKVKATIRNNCQYFTFNEIQSILYYVSMKVVINEMQFYCEKIVDGLCTAVLQHNVTFSQGMTILRNLNKMRHSNISLLDHLATKCVEDRNILTFFDVNHFINGFIIADYKPPCWESIQTMLLNFVTNTDYSIYKAVPISFRLLSLDCYCPELLNKVFTLCQSKFMNIKNESIATVLKLHWCVKLFYPEYNGVTISEAVLDQMYINYNKEEVPSLLESLKEALARAEYIMSGLRTKFSVFIDHVVVIQPNGFPMNVNDYNADIRFVEELESLSECSKILFLAYPEKAYSLNKRNMLRTVQLELKPLETLKGFYTIVINPYLWKHLSNDKKVLYLQQAMKSKCNISGMPKYD